MANNEPINSLPEYEIRTMESDLDKSEGRAIEKKPEKLELPKTPPQTLPIVEKVPTEIKKTPLPGTEEFIGKIIPKEIKPEEIKKVRKPTNLKKILIPTIIVLAIIAIGIFFYWQGKIEEEQQQLPPVQQPEEIQVSESLFPIDETKLIEIKNNTSLLSLLKIEADIDQLSETFKRIVPMKNEKEILSLNELVQELRIAIYPYVLPELKDKYTLVLYSQNKKSRLGLVVEAINIANLKEQSKFWEKTMSEDLKNLFLNEVSGGATSKVFHDNAYKEIAIRYINFSNLELTIDYAIFDNLFILSVSKESMYRIIDRLKL